MRKDTIILLCSPHINRMVSRRCLGALKATDLSRAELHLFDNNWDPDFCHTVVIEKMLRQAESRGMNLVILDDDVEIYRSDWLDRLYEVSEDMDADIVGCIHTNDVGEINHVGEYLKRNGMSASLMEFRHEAESIVNNAVYVPTLCSAVMLIRHPERYHMDMAYKKYKMDLDICLKAWDQGEKVAIALDMQIIHNRGYTGEQNKSFRQLLDNDATYFVQKWKDKKDALLSKPELVQYKDFDPLNNWGEIYGTATELMKVDREASIALFQEVADRSYIRRLAAGANFYLYKLTGELPYIEKCNQLNPCHVAAQKIVAEAGGTPRRHCDHMLDCRHCDMRRFSFVYNRINNILHLGFQSI